MNHLNICSTCLCGVFCCCCCLFLPQTPPCICDRNILVKVQAPLPVGSTGHKVSKVKVHTDCLHPMLVLIPLFWLQIFLSPHVACSGSATSISVWQHVKLSEQIHPRDTLACCWDVKQPTNKQCLFWALMHGHD